MGLRLLPWTFVFARRIQRLVVRISNTILFLSVCRCIVYRIMGDSHGIVGWKLVEKDFRDIFDGYDGLDSGTIFKLVTWHSCYACWQHPFMSGYPHSLIGCWQEFYCCHCWHGGVVPCICCSLSWHSFMKYSFHKAPNRDCPVSPCLSLLLF